MATIKDVALLANVSTATVSRALSSKVTVDSATKARVLAAVKELNYTPNLMARGLKDGKSKTFGLILPDISNLYYPKIAKSIGKYASEQGYSIILCNTNESVEEEKKQLQTLKNRQVDGIICLNTGEDISHFLNLINDGVPFTMVNRLFNDDINCITSDNRYGASQMVTHLIKNGHKKIACLFRSFTNQIYKERFEGCEKTLNDNNILDFEKYFAYDVNTIEDAFNATLALLRGDNPPTAIFASTDMMTIGIYSAINCEGLTIPNDISVVGYDNIQISNMMIPPLTTFHQSVDEIGKRAIDNLISQINGEKKVEKTILKGEVLERKSVKNIGGKYE